MMRKQNRFVNDACTCMKTIATRPHLTYLAVPQTTVDNIGRFLPVNLLQLHGVAAPTATVCVDELGGLERLLSMVPRDTHENA